MTPKHCCDWDGDHLIGPCLNNGQQDEKNFNKFCYDLDPWLIQYSSWHKTDSILLFLTYRHFCSTWARSNKSEIIFGLTLIIKRSVMTFTLTWFKITAHHEQKCFDYVKNKANRAKWTAYICSEKRNFA